jgi:hypothetical protein
MVIHHLIKDCQVDLFASRCLTNEINLSAGDQIPRQSTQMPFHELGQKNSICLPSIQPDSSMIQQRWLPLWSAQPWLASADRNADRLSSLSERQPRTLDSHVKSRVNPSTVSHSQTSHPENIRAHFTSACISSTAVELLSNSIKASTAKSYNCSWSKWNCWCDKRQSNPIFFPIEDILTFLADQ